MNNALWYYAYNNQSIGPVNKNEIQALINSGDLTSDTLVWNESLRHWLKISEIDCFEKKVVSPPIPPNNKIKLMPQKYLSILIPFIAIIIVFFFISSRNNIRPNSINEVGMGIKSVAGSLRKKLTVQDIAKYSNSVLLIQVYDKSHELIGLGSGFVVTADGKLVTNYHVIDGAEYVEVVSNDDIKYNVTGVTGFDIDKDLAVLKLEKVADLPIVKIGNSDKLEAGEDVVAIGSPIGLKNTVSAGNISAFREMEKEKIIQITTPISPGSSGGALFNMYGEVVGVTFASIVEGQNINFAIPINDYKYLINCTELISFRQLIDKVYARGNSTGNIANGGLACIKDDWIYYSNLDDEEKLYRIKSDLTNNLKLSDNSVRYINVVGDWIYYSNESNQIKLHMMDLNGNNDRKLSDIGRVANINAFNDSVYFTAMQLSYGDIEEKMIRLSIKDGETDIISNKQPYFLAIDDGWAYFTDFNQNTKLSSLNKIRVDGTNFVELIKTEAHNIIVSNEWIFYRDFNRGIYKMKKDGSNLVKIGRDDTYSFNIYGEWLYYSNVNDGEKLYRIRTDGTGNAKVSDKSVVDINIVGNWIYCREINPNDNIIERHINKKYNALWIPLE